MKEMRYKVTYQNLIHTIYKIYSLLSSLKSFNIEEKTRIGRKNIHNFFLVRLSNFQTPRKQDG